MFRQLVASTLFWALSLGLLGPLATPARAQIPVTDVAHIVVSTGNWINRILDLANQYLQYANMIQRYYTMLNQYYTMLKNLELNEQFVYRFLGRYLVYMQELTQVEGGLGYNTPFDALWSLLREYFPGIVDGMERMRNLGWKDPYVENANTALGTLRGTLLAASRTKIEVNQGERELDRIQAIARSADGNMKAIEASNMLLGHLAHQGGVQMVLLATMINAQNVYAAHQLQEESQKKVQSWESFTAAWRHTPVLLPLEGPEYRPLVPVGF
jgi:P-type conjugative transfer protein TrbJ